MGVEVLCDLIFLIVLLSDLYGASFEQGTSYRHALCKIHHQIIFLKSFALIPVRTFGLYMSFDI